MALANEILKFFATYIEAETGIVYTDVNYYQLENRLVDIATQLGCATPVELYERARAQGFDPSMRLLLLDTATNNETLFFRDIPVFKALAGLMGQVATAQTNPFRIWSAACSTGQEIYSLAILATEQRVKTPGFAWSILATDFSERVLKRAEEGRYSQLEVQRGLSAARLIQHFEQVAERDGGITSWAVRAALKAHMKFKPLNLITPWPDLGTFDLILCRNVLIYQNVENKIKVIEKLFERLAPGGHLVLGGAESLIGLSNRFEFVATDGAVIYRRPATGSAAA
jgi:chemotaxis protein methyltransferase CheR